ncbi:response regulator [Candidatus Micrarchaeota archaeon]|nr:response regulator [Candidatus Micrarchaeota archaeon]
MERIRVLCLDDDEDIRRLIKFFFTRKNFEVITCQDIQSAKKAEKNAQIDVIISDLFLPEGGTVGFIEEMMKKGHPIIIFTAAEWKEMPRIDGVVIVNKMDEYGMDKLIKEVESAAGKKPEYSGAKNISELTKPGMHIKTPLEKRFETRNDEETVLFFELRQLEREIRISSGNGTRTREFNEMMDKYLELKSRLNKIREGNKKINPKKKPKRILQN